MQYLPKELRVYMDYQKINLRLNEHCSVFLIMSGRLLFILWKYECAFVIKNAIILWMSDLDVRTWIRIIAVLVLAFGEWGVESVRYLKVNVGKRMNCLSQTWGGLFRRDYMLTTVSWIDRKACVLSNKLVFVWN